MIASRCIFCFPFFFIYFSSARLLPYNSIIFSGESSQKKKSQPSRVVVGWKVFDTIRWVQPFHCIACVTIFLVYAFLLLFPCRRHHHHRWRLDSTRPNHHHHQQLCCCNFTAIVTVLSATASKQYILHTTKANERSYECIASYPLRSKVTNISPSPPSHPTSVCDKSVVVTTTMVVVALLILILCHYFSGTFLCVFRLCLCFNLGGRAGRVVEVIMVASWYNKPDNTGVRPGWVKWNVHGIIDWHTNVLLQARGSVVAAR